MLEVRSSGFQSTIQDLGRVGYRNYGVPLSGCMDIISAQIANALLNNQKEDAVIEMPLVGPVLRFTQPTVIAIAGADLSPKLNERRISNYHAYTIKKNDLLSFGKLRRGSRSYLAVKYGFKTPKVLNSRSFYKRITPYDILRNGDVIPYIAFKAKIENLNSSLNFKSAFYDTCVLEVMRGAEMGLFSDREIDLILQKKYVIQENSRMGYRFSKSISGHKKSIVTAPVLSGTVQLTPSGHCIVFMKDAPTTGGYPRLLQLSEKSIAVLAQKRRGDVVSLKYLNFSQH